MPYSRYFRRSLEYRIIEGVSRYREYVRRGLSYDSSSIPITSLKGLIEEKRRLEREEGIAEENHSSYIKGNSKRYLRVLSAR